MTDWPGEPSSTREEMMQATYRALCNYGYAETSIQRIADEFDKSKSLLYYHYEDKQALLADFLTFLLEEFSQELETIPDDEPREAIELIVEVLLPVPLDEHQLEFRKAIVEIRSQAPYHEGYREQIARFDGLIQGELATALERGVRDAAFQPVDSEETAEFVYTTLIGAIHRAVTLDDPELATRSRDVLDEYLRESVYREE